MTSRRALLIQRKTASCVSFHAVPTGWSDFVALEDNQREFSIRQAVIYVDLDVSLFALVATIS